MSFYEVDAVIDTEEAAREVIELAEGRSEIAFRNGTYEIAQRPGQYLVCVDSVSFHRCRSATVEPDTVTVAHVRSSLALPSIVLFGEDERELPPTSMTIRDEQ